MLILINLHPWRKRARIQQRKDFYILLAEGILLASVLIVILFIYFKICVTGKQSEIEKCYEKLNKLNPLYNKVNALKQQFNYLQEMTFIIHKIKTSQENTIFFFKTIVMNTPQEIIFFKMRRIKNQIIISGNSNSTFALTHFIKLFAHTQLLEIKQDAAHKFLLFQFRIFQNDDVLQTA